MALQLLKALVGIWLIVGVFAVTISGAYGDESDDLPDFSNVQLWTCNGGQHQSWKTVTSGYPNNNIVLNMDKRVLDISAWRNDTGTNLQIFHKTTTPWNQQFHYNTTTHEIVSLMNGMCVDVANHASTAGSNVYMWTCSRGHDQKSQKWIYNETDGTFHYGQDSELCLDAGTVVNCTMPPYNSYIYCNYSNSVADRVADLLSRMTLPEKTQLLQNRNPGIPRLGVPKLPFGECLHGVHSGCLAAAGNTTGCPTSFPHALGLGATFNRSLWSHVGSSISTEARALHNQGIAALAFWAPDINLFRDPRWGRGQEVPGEDPTLTAEYVYHYSRGLQEGDDTRYLKVVSTCKHFSAYDLESWNGTNRHQFNAIVSDQDLVEYYLVPFRSCVERAHAQSIMCSYNAVNGVPSCANSLLQNTIVRDEWGFDGFIVSDCGAISNIISSHNYTNTSGDTCRAGILGGCDLNCGSYYGSHLEDAVNGGSLTEGDVDVSVVRVLKHMLRLGLLDPMDIQPYAHIPPEVVDSPEHRQLALEAAEEMIVLLKNNGMLPLDSSKLSSVAIVGPHGNATQDMLSNYHGTNVLVNSHSPLQAITAMLGESKVKYEMGCDIAGSDTSHIADAVNAAKASDAALLFIGINGGQENEGHDRTSLDLPGVQLQLVQQVFAANKNTVVILINGGPLAVEWIKDNVPAIVEALYPGEMGGDAIANILFGKVSPSGRLPYTIYPSSFTDRSFFDMNLRDNGGCTYRYYTGKALWWFGDGLSYTNFTYSWAHNTSQHGRRFLAQDIGRGNDQVEYTVTVKNTGEMASDEVVLGFVMGQLPNNPQKELFDFGRVHLEPGQSATVHLSMPAEVLATVDKDGVQAIRSGEYKIRVGELESSFFVYGGSHELFSLAQMKRRHEEKSKPVLV